jgi:hypothetical protein
MRQTSIIRIKYSDKFVILCILCCLTLCNSSLASENNWDFRICSFVRVEFFV